MINTKIIAATKTSATGGSGNTYVTVNGSGFEGHYLWGQWFDDTQDIDGDLTSSGKIQSETIETNNLKVNDKLSVYN